MMSFSETLDTGSPVARKKKIVFVTGTRAEFGLLTPVLLAARASDRITMLLYATGTHPVAAHGRTLTEL